MKRLLIGFKTNDKDEIGTVLYQGNDGDKEKKVMEKSTLFRFETYQVGLPQNRKYKEENAYVEGKAIQENKPKAAKA